MMFRTFPMLRTCTIALLACFLLTFLAPASSRAQLLRKKGTDSDQMLDQAKAELNKKDYRKAIGLLQKASDISPRNLDVRMLLGRAYMLNAQYDRSRAELLYVTRQNPRYREAYGYLINLESTTGNWSEALCYADDGLYYYPSDREFILKKLDILSHLRSRHSADRFADQLLDSYPDDTAIVHAYIATKLASGRAFRNSGNISRARYDLEKVLEQDPGNKEALEEIYNLEIRSGNYDQSLAFVNRALQLSPKSYELLMKKVGIQQLMHQYADALETLQQLRKQYPADVKARQLEPELRMEAGRYYMSTDPYFQFRSVLEQSPGNREALDYVINLSYARGLYQESLLWINKGLRSNPNDGALLKKKMGVLEQLKSYPQAAEIAERLWRRGGSAADREHYLELKVLSGKQFLADLDYDKAMAEFRTALLLQPDHPDALNYAINVCTAQKNYEEALQLVDDALGHAPGSEMLLFKKSGILESAGRYSEAAAISKELTTRYPENRRYQLAFIDQSLAAGRQSMQAEDYEQSVALLKDILVNDPGNTEALQYLINIETGLQQYDTAVYYADQALQHHPDSRDFLFKKASVLNEAGRYAEAYAITGDLYRQYPYIPKFRQAYADQLLASGRRYQNENRPDSALLEYARVLRIAPRDTNALLYTINLLNETKEYDSAMAMTNRALYYYPKNADLWMKKAVVYENRQQYRQASLAMDTSRLYRPYDLRTQDYADYLKSKTLRNEFGLFFLHSSYDYQDKSANIATVQYLRRFRKGSLAGRLNYAGRLQGTGLQVELEGYYNHTPRWYSYGVVAYSNQIVFPEIRAGYSLFHMFGKVYEAELGARYLRPSDSTNAVSGLASLARYFGDFWFNVRGFYTSLDGNTYQSGVLTGRYYTGDNKTDYIQVNGSYGTTPDERSLNFQYERIADLKTISIGAGFQKQFKYRTTIGLFGNWINQQLTDNTYQNQYDIYISLQRKF